MTITSMAAENKLQYRPGYRHCRDLRLSEYELTTLRQLSKIKITDEDLTRRLKINTIGAKQAFMGIVREEKVFHLESALNSHKEMGSGKFIQAEEVQGAKSFTTNTDKERLWFIFLDAVLIILYKTLFAT